MEESSETIKDGAVQAEPNSENELMPHNTVQDKPNSDNELMPEETSSIEDEVAPSEDREKLRIQAYMQKVSENGKEAYNL